MLNAGEAASKEVFKISRESEAVWTPAVLVVEQFLQDTNFAFITGPSDQPKSPCNK